MQLVRENGQNGIQAYLANGLSPLGLRAMQRIHFLQHWFNLSDPAAEKALYGSASLLRFFGEAIHVVMPEMQNMTLRRVKSTAGVSEDEKRRNRNKGQVRSKVEWLCASIALVNLCQHRKRLAATAA